MQPALTNNTNFKLNFASPTTLASQPSLLFPHQNFTHPFDNNDLNIQSKKETSEPYFSTPRKSTPSSFATPTRTREQCSDRFIPVRNDMVDRKLIYDTPEDPFANSGHKVLSEEEQSQFRYQMLLEGQLLGLSRPSVSAGMNLCGLEDTSLSLSRSSSMKEGSNKMLKFKTPTKERSSSNKKKNISSLPFDWDQFEEEKVSSLRTITKKPFKVLDAPQLEDDYYLNLIDWSQSNILAVALQDSVHLWSGSTGIVKQLCQLPDSGDMYTSLSWSTRGECLATGISNGKLEVWDFNKMKVIRNDLEAHQGRVGCLAWNGQDILASGSKDQSIILRDMRIKGNRSTITRLKRHRQEICGLKWSPNDFQLASGGNDNKLYVWNVKANEPETCFADHKAAVKALAWSPHQSGLLLSGGGNNDKTIKVWNTHTMKNIRSINTGSQVCNMTFSKNSNELVTTHGFSNNQIIVWNYPDFTKLGVMEGHASRVLYLALSPDGESVVTGAGAADETLRFWNVFPPAQMESKSSLLPSSIDLR